MYKFENNKTTDTLEMKKIDFNCHPSVIDKKAFDEVFTREYARFEYFSLKAKYLNDKVQGDDLIKMDLLDKEFDIATVKHSVFDGVADEIKPLLILTLYAHGKLLDDFKSNIDEESRIVASKLGLGLNDFYVKCKEVIKDIENGTKSIEEAVKIIKPLYNASTGIVNHEAVEGVCKKWTANTKEYMTRAFVTGLISRYKLTRANKLKGDSPLKSQLAFEKYFASWVVSNGEMVQEKAKGSNIEAFASFVNRH